jgi:hypothetical protein
MAGWLELLPLGCAVVGGLLLLTGVMSSTGGAETMLAKYEELLRTARAQASTPHTDETQ